MVSNTMIIGMIMAVIIPLSVIILMLLWIGKYSKRRETGLIGASCYGFLGYFWQELLYMFAYLGIAGGLFKSDAFRGGLGAFVVQILLSIAYGIFTALGTYWGVFLTNDKQKSLYRSTAIGVGFTFGYTAWTYFASYGIPVKTVYQIMSGVNVDEKLKNQVLGLSVGNMYMFAVNCVIFLFIFAAVTLLMGNLYLQKKRIKACLIPCVVAGAINLLNWGLAAIIPLPMLSTIMFYTITGLGALYGLVIVARFLRTGKVDWKILNNNKML